jgi:hypothetical protein
LGSVSPTVRMPDPERARALALRGELVDALCVARCSAQLAGFETEDFMVRELLLTVMQQIDRAADIIRRCPLVPPHPSPPAPPSPSR